MKSVLVTALLLLAAVGFTQPVIDHMLVDERLGQLKVYGRFGSSPGRVIIDSVDLIILSWTDSVVIATISATGKGSSGPVHIDVDGNQSNIRVISSWSMDIFSMYRHIMSNSRQDGSAFIL